ncbi:hypothetical protein ABV409_01610 [Flagellimonas sp. DF-77]|uniref:hypothetical protein n=1 Tax=Flagellimonas algarum TaxID=3230298 RepID=UPI00339B2D9A
MEKTRFYPTVWQTMVSPSGVAGQWDLSGNPIREIVLKNDQLTQGRISELDLHINKVSLMDAADKEQTLMRFSKPAVLPIKGRATGHFLKSKNTVNLPEGRYHKLRFYVEGKKQGFAFEDGRFERIDCPEVLEFDIANGLELDGNTQPEIKFWFDLVPFSAVKYLKRIWGKFINRPTRQKPRLARG